MVTYGLSRRYILHPTIALTLASLLILVCCSSLFLYAVQPAHSAYHNDVVVTGSPRLTVAQVEHIFASVGSPMAGTGKIVVQAAQETQIDNAFALAVWWTETNDGAAGVGLADRNPGSVRGTTGYPVAYDGYTIYPSYEVAIRDWFKLLRQGYMNRGLNSVYTICYPYVGTTGATMWADKVYALMMQYRGEARTYPTPTPTSRALPLRPAQKPHTSAKPQGVIQHGQPQLKKSGNKAGKGATATAQKRAVEVERVVEKTSVSRPVFAWGIVSWEGLEITIALLLLATLVTLIRLVWTQYTAEMREERSGVGKAVLLEPTTEALPSIRQTSLYHQESVRDDGVHSVQETSDMEYDTQKLVRVERNTEEMSPVPPTPMLRMSVSDVPPTPTLAPSLKVPLTPFVRIW